MWLINTTTLLLEEFDDPAGIDYAILSHTWGDEEISFRGMGSLSRSVRSKRKRGHDKIVKTCEMALRKGLSYAWVDTCCIDKTSSAELSEAINAMFLWYQGAKVCFVYLEDLSPEKEHGSAEGSPKSHQLLDEVDLSPDIQELSSCKWFTRGWTLQELIAPGNIEFYDSDWQFRFTKKTMASQLSRITRIDISVLEMTKGLKDFPVAVKMSWAANRQTRRPEDIAYSLLGIFGINMPMLYGERHKAFQRLQETIASHTDDASLFAWLSDDESQRFRGIFANSPDEFAHQTNYTRGSEPRFAITNKGIHFRASAWSKESKLFLLALGVRSSCERHRGPWESRGTREHEVSISLLFTADGYVRFEPWRCFRLVGKPSSNMEIYAKKHVSPDESSVLQQLGPPLTVHLGPRRWALTGYPARYWNSLRSEFSGDAMTEDFVGCVFIHVELSVPLTLVLVCYKLVNENVDVDICVRETGDWRVVQDRTWRHMRNEYTDTFDSGMVLMRYKSEKFSGSFQPQKSVRVGRREEDGRFSSTMFEAKVLTRKQKRYEPKHTSAKFKAYPDDSRKRKRSPGCDPPDGLEAAHYKPVFTYMVVDVSQADTDISEYRMGNSPDSGGATGSPGPNMDHIIE